MSAFISMTYPDRVELLADGATCLPTGTLIAKTDKIAASPHKPLAVVGRGRAVELEQIADFIIGMTEENSVDDTINAVAYLLDNGGFVVTENPYEVVIACWSETQGPRHYVFTSLPRPDLEAFRLYNWDGLMGGGVAITPEDIPGIGKEDIERGLRDVAVPLFEAFRRKGKADDWGYGEAYWIGGHVDFAVIDRDGVRAERVHEWPDQLFKKINPSPAECGAFS